MAGKRLGSPNHSPHNQKSSLAMASDFCDFQTSEAHERSSNEELDSDIEDAIYAKMYFTTADNPQQKVTEVKSSQDCGMVVSLGSSSGMGGTHFPPTETRNKKNKEGSEKKPHKRKKKKKRLDSTESSVVGTSTGCSNVVVIDIESDPNSTGEASTAAADGKARTLSSTTVKQSLAGKTRRAKETAITGSESPESDVKRLFQTPKKLTNTSTDMVIDLTINNASSSNFVDLTNGSSENEDDVSVVRSSSSSRSTSMESGETRSLNSVSSGGGDDPWYINEKDRIGRDAYERLLGNKEISGRYYGTLKCTNCKQKGHPIKSCPWPKRHVVCYLCAELGHISSNCPNSLCTYCYQMKHRGVGCRVPWAGPNTICNRCFMKGHHASTCPDLWRQFHHTTYANNYLVTISGSMQRRCKNVYCSNCSERGHYAFECTRSYHRSSPAQHLPLIAVYDKGFWPPKDRYSLAIIACCRAKSDSKLSSIDGSGRKRKLSIVCSSDEGKPPDNSPPPPPPPPQRKKKKRNSKKKDKERDSLIEEEEGEDYDHSTEEGSSLLVTVDGRGSRLSPDKNRRKSSLVFNQDSSRLRPHLLTTPSPSYTDRPHLLPTPLNRSKSYLFNTPSSSSGGDFPRESFNHTPYRHHGNDRLDGEMSYAPSPAVPHHQHTRTLSVDLDQRHHNPMLINRRYSDHDRRHGPPSLHNRSWPSHDPVNIHHNRDYIEMDRGFRMAEKTAREMSYHGREPERHWRDPPRRDACDSRGHDHYRY